MNYVVGVGKETKREIMKVMIIMYKTYNKGKKKIGEKIMEVNIRVFVKIIFCMIIFLNSSVIMNILKLLISQLYRVSVIENLHSQIQQKLMSSIESNMGRFFFHF